MSENATRRRPFQNTDDGVFLLVRLPDHSEGNIQK